MMVSELNVNGFLLKGLCQKKLSPGIWEAEIYNVEKDIYATGSGHLPLLALGNAIIDMHRLLEPEFNEEDYQDLL